MQIARQEEREGGEAVQRERESTRFPLELQLVQLGKWRRYEIEFGFPAKPGKHTHRAQRDTPDIV